MTEKSKFLPSLGHPSIDPEVREHVASILLDLAFLVEQPVEG
ncbi:MAG: hypothetical protein WCC94_03215 [Candidatus Bathyarchaeia archaeon]